MYGGGREKKGAAHETKKTKRETKRSKQAAAAAEAEADDGAAPSGNKRDKWLKKDSEDEHGSRRSAAWQPPQGEVDGSLGEQVFMRWDEVLGYADSYVPERTSRSLRTVRTGYAYHSLRAARTGGAGQLAPRVSRTVRTPYAYQPRACRAYRALWHPR